MIRSGPAARSTHRDRTHHKEAINLAGFQYSGHTEIYADFTHTKDYAMMLVHDRFRVIHVSTHVSMREACDRVKKDRVCRVIRLGYDAVRKLGVENPRIAVAGLNPHAGEAGLMGREEIEEIEPAIRQAQAEGLNVEGPIPPDTVFSKMQGGQYDLVVVMYHDQGHIPTKIIGFQYDAKPTPGKHLRRKHHLRPSHHPGFRGPWDGLRQGRRGAGQPGESGGCAPDCLPVRFARLGRHRFSRLDLHSSMGHFLGEFGEFLITHPGRINDLVSKCPKMP